MAGYHGYQSAFSTFLATNRQSATDRADSSEQLTAMDLSTSRSSRLEDSTSTGPARPDETIATRPEHSSSLGSQIRQTAAHNQPNVPIDTNVDQSHRPTAGPDLTPDLQNRTEILPAQASTPLSTGQSTSTAERPGSWAANQPMGAVPVPSGELQADPTTLPSHAIHKSSSTKSIGSKLDLIAQKLMGGISNTPSTTDDVTVTSLAKNLPQDEAAIELEGVDDSLDAPPPARPFSELSPPYEDNQPEFVEELVSDNIPPDFSEVLDDNSSQTGQSEASCSQPAQSETSSLQADQSEVSCSQAGQSDVLGELDGSTPRATLNNGESTLTAEESEMIDESEMMAESEILPAAPVPETPAVDPDEHVMTAEKVFEYQWPADTGGEIYLLQEQLSEYLGVLSFKRKYPDLTRRPVDYKERIFLMEKGVVTETQCDLGLTALRSEEVYEFMAKDYPGKYKDYMDALREKERKRLAEETKGYNMQNLEKAKLAFLLKKAVKSAADFNAQFMREKRDERRAYFDLQTFEVQYPRTKYKPLPPEMTKMDEYPVALIPGQYQSYYKQYTPSELKYFPVKTALYSPHKALQSIYVDPQTDGGVREGGEEVKEAASSSSDDSDTSSDSDGADSIEEETANKSQVSEEQIRRLLAAKRPDTPPKKTRKRAAPADTDTDSPAPKPKPKARRGGPGRGNKGPMPRGRPTLKCSICGEIELPGVQEERIYCSECRKPSHPSCVDMTPEMIPVIKTYDWQCMECKTCLHCKQAHDEDKMMFCDLCDRGYHTYCVGLDSIPPGRWECPNCKTQASENSNHGNTEVVSGDGVQLQQQTVAQ